MLRREFLTLAGTAALSALSARTARAEVYPARPVRLLVPYAPGGPADIIARLAGQKLSERLGKPFYVENVGGAGGNIGIAQGARAAADGYTMLVVPPNIVVNQAMYETISYDPYKDFDPVTVAVKSPTVVTVHPSVAAASIGDLVKLIKSDGAKFSFSSPGVGTPPHLLGEHFRLSLGLDLVHVPFNSAGQAVASTLAGHTPIAFSSLPPAIPHIKEGKLRALAVTSKERTRVLPDVPSLMEAGYPIEGEGWFAFIVPAGTPKEISGTLHTEIAKAMDLPDVREKLAALGFEAIGTPPEESARYFRSEGVRWSKVIREAGIKGQ